MNVSCFLVDSTLTERQQSSSPQRLLMKCENSSQKEIIQGQLYSFGAEFPHQLTETRILADRFEVAIFFHELKVSVAKLDRPAKRSQCHVCLLEQSISAGKIVVGCWIGRSRGNQLFIHRQPILKPALGGQVAGLNPQNFRIGWKDGEQLSEELDLKIELAAIGEKSKNGPWWECVLG